MSTQRFTATEMNVLQLAPALANAINPALVFEPNPIVHQGFMAQMNTGAWVMQPALEAALNTLGKFYTTGHIR